MTSQFDCVLVVDDSWLITLEQNCWKFTSTNSCNTKTHMHSMYLVYTVDRILHHHTLNISYIILSVVVCECTSRSNDININPVHITRSISINTVNFTM